MRLITLALCLGILCCGQAAAQDDFLFRGSYSIISKNQACVGRNPVGDDGLIRLSVAADGKGSAFTLYHPLISQAFRLNGSLFNTTFKPVATMTVRARFAPGTHPVQVRFAQQVPATITPNTAFLSFVGSIKGYGSTTDCVVAFRAALTKNLD